MRNPERPCAADAWIDPDGRFYPVDDCGHYEAAGEIVRDRGIAVEKYAGDTLENIGWVHLTFATIRVVGVVNQAQINTLFDVMYAYQAEANVRADHMRTQLDAILRRIDEDLM